MTTTTLDRKPVFVFSHPRTASNLFMKIFKSHPDVIHSEYPFLKVFFFGSTESQYNRKGPKIDEARAGFQETSLPKSYYESFNKLEEDIRSAGEQVSFLLFQQLSERGLILVKRAK